MKRMILALLAGALLASAGTAIAGSNQTTVQTMHSKGVLCQTGGTGIVCIQESAEGYGVGISVSQVLVMNVDSSRTVYKHAQP